jgi:S1-C subfamily serine protease
MKRLPMLALGAAALLAGLTCGLLPSRAAVKSVAESEKRRIATINLVKPAVVAVMGRDGRGNIVGNGSGVLIDEEGHALTNFHVTSAVRSPAMKCGLPDGELYDAILVGLDPVGDIALIKLLPNKPGAKFPFVKLGDSDKVKAGDWSLCMGNPFGLAYDFTPTVTFGMVSSTHRFINIGKMEYTNCLQVDTSINPGNSGGPLFNMDGELIGINSAISVSRRRANCGVGFSVSINQIKNFLGSLKVGLITDHASLGAAMESESEDGALSRILVRSIIESDARRRGLEVGDELISFNGMRATTVNQYKNLLGQFPRGWRLPMVYKRESTRTEILVRLMGVTRRELEEAPKGGPAPPPPPPITGPAAKLYKAKRDFANYYFNEQAQQRLLKDFTDACGDFSKVQGSWMLKIGGKTLAGGGKNVEAGVITILESGAADKKSPKVELDLDGLIFPLEPLSVGSKSDDFKDPPGSGGFTLAMYHYRQLLAFGPKGFTSDFHHGGVEPFYPATSDEKPKWSSIRVMTEVLVTRQAGVPGKWFFALEDDKSGRWKKGQLIGFEITADKDSDPCEVCLSDYKDVGGGRKLPGKIHVRSGNGRYADFLLNSATLK